MQQDPRSSISLAAWPCLGCGRSGAQPSWAMKPFAYQATSTEPSKAFPALTLRGLRRGGARQVLPCIPRPGSPHGETRQTRPWHKEALAQPKRRWRSCCRPGPWLLTACSLAVTVAAGSSAARTGPCAAAVSGGGADGGRLADAVGVATWGGEVGVHWWTPCFCAPWRGRWRRLRG